MSWILQVTCHRKFSERASTGIRRRVGRPGIDQPHHMTSNIESDASVLNPGDQTLRVLDGMMTVSDCDSLLAENPAIRRKMNVTIRIPYSPIPTACRTAIAATGPGDDCRCGMLKMPAVWSATVVFITAGRMLHDDSSPVPTVVVASANRSNSDDAGDTPMMSLPSRPFEPAKTSISASAGRRPDIRKN